MWHARFRLASLWLSQSTRLMADYCLRIFVILQLAEGGAQEREAAWHVVIALFMAPAILFAPFNGALSNTLPRRWVLVGTAAYCLAVIGGGALLGLPWLALWGLLALGSVIYYPTRYAVLPAAAEETQVPLTRVNGLIEMGAALAIVFGLVAGYQFTRGGWTVPAELLGEAGPPPAVALALALSAVCLVTALPARFRGDVRRPEPPAAAVRDFFGDVRRIFQVREARLALLTMAGLRGLVAGSTGALLAVVFSRHENQTGPQQVADVMWIGLWLGLGAAAGSLLAGVQRHPRRALGLVPLGATGLALGLALAALTGDTGPVLAMFLGFVIGLANVPLAAAYQANVPADTRGNGMAVRQLFEYVAMTALAVTLVGLVRLGLPPLGQFWVVAALAVLLVAVCWRLLAVVFLELGVELLMWPLYRVRATGPGLDRIPVHGPLLVVANHSSYFDPLWLGKILPRHIRPMMTSLFYDLPGLRWLMKHVVGAIRVQFSPYRREAPELQEAIAALDAGECVVIFPEGSLRRDEARPLRQFGQGVWHILHQRPQTPVVLCWIEGGWGSYCSYFKGPPLRNKRLDWFRRIDVVVAEPLRVAPELLADQRATRTYLMERCLETRRHLGLAEVRAEVLEEEVADTAS